jgi:micrococcal nuclease
VRRRRTITLAFACALVLAAAAVFLVLRSRGDDDPDLPPDVGVVEWVIDGDTVDIDIAGTEERVRLLGINTPETHTDTGVPECYGPEASAFTRSLLPVGTEVRLVRDVVGRDDYDRLLAYVFRRDDDLFVNAAIVGGGYGRPLSIGPNTAYADRFVAAATAAEAGDLGLWGACGG